MPALKPLSTALIATALILAGIALFLALQSRQASRQGALDGSERYDAGQVWAIQTPPDQLDARITILRADFHPRLGKVIHISMEGVELPDGAKRIPHMPMSEDAIDRSVTKLIRTEVPPPPLPPEYTRWREAIDAGKGGIFRTSVAESFQVVREAYTQISR